MTRDKYAIGSSNSESEASFLDDVADFLDATGKVLWNAFAGPERPKSAPLVLKEITDSRSFGSFESPLPPIIEDHSEEGQDESTDLASIPTMGDVMDVGNKYIPSDENRSPSPSFEESHQNSNTMRFMRIVGTASEDWSPPVLVPPREDTGCTGSAFVPPDNCLSTTKNDETAYTSGTGNVRSKVLSYQNATLQKVSPLDNKDGPAVKKDTSLQNSTSVPADRTENDSIVQRLFSFDYIPQKSESACDDSTLSTHASLGSKLQSDSHSRKLSTNETDKQVEGSISGPKVVLQNMVDVDRSKGNNVNPLKPSTHPKAATKNEVAKKSANDGKDKATTLFANSLLKSTKQLVSKKKTKRCDTNVKKVQQQERAVTLFNSPKSRRASPAENEFLQPTKKGLKASNKSRRTEVKERGIQEQREELEPTRNDGTTLGSTLLSSRVS